MDLTFEEAVNRYEVLLKKTEWYADVIESHMNKCGRDPSKLTDEEEEDLDTIMLLMEPLTKELNVLTLFISANSSTRSN